MWERVALSGRATTASSRLFPLVAFEAVSGPAIACWSHSRAIDGGGSHAAIRTEGSDTGSAGSLRSCVALANPPHQGRRPSRAGAPGYCRGAPGVRRGAHDVTSSYASPPAGSIDDPEGALSPASYECQRQEAHDAYERLLAARQQSVE